MSQLSTAQGVICSTGCASDALHYVRADPAFDCDLPQAVVNRSKPLSCKVIELRYNESYP